MQTYLDELTAWRKAQEAELTKEGGWLSVVGLFWLNEGDNPLPPALRALGKLVRTGESVRLYTPEGERRLLRPNSTEKLTKGSVTGQILQRGKRLGIRVYDSESPARKNFTGQHWFAPEEAYRITATFHPYPQGKTLAITNVLGDTQPVPCPGYVTFPLDGKLCRLEAQGTPSGLFFNFHDLTSGKTTYPAGRFLDTEKPANGRVVLDFNRAVSPPCAFTEFATCPLPPRANYLPIALSVGEKKTH
ncbi:DUF1684 domain-containing protein [Armatimonas sp.]|uniref:DUF1684 domain-containing protein n=1 Tax=Armatimonas sp. TaxID=1872638 RepID=UPI00375325AE